MKNLFLFTIVLSYLILSCQKPPAEVGGVPVADSILNCVHVYNSLDHVNGFDSFCFDNAGRLSRLVEYEFDSSSTPLQVDSTIRTFSFTGADTLPNTYTVLAKYDTANVYYTESHRLLYDNQGRVVMDTVISGPQGGYRTVHYGYIPGGVVRSVMMTDRTSGKNLYEMERDTLALLNGNIASDLAHLDPDIAPWNWGLSTYTYTNIKSAFYSLGLSKSLGALLHYELQVDVCSAQMVAQSREDAFNWTTPLITNYFWQTNGNGTLIAGHDDQGFEFSFHYLKR